MTYTFLVLNLFIFLIPFVFLLDRKVSGVENLKYIVLPSFIVTFIVSEVAVFLTGVKAWSFNSDYLVGVSYRGLPLEEYIFIFAFSFAGLGIYNYLNAKFPNNDLQKYSLAVSNLMIGIGIAFLFFGHTKWYTLIIFAFLLLLLFGVEYINRIRFMYRFYRTFLVMLLPFYGIYVFMCNLPIVQYDTAQNVRISLAKVPLENYFLMMTILLLAVYSFEIIKSRRKV